MKLFVAMVSLTLFVAVLRSPASSALTSAPDVGDIIHNRPTATPTPAAVTSTPTPTAASTATPAPTAQPTPTPQRTATPAPRCTTACQIRGRVTQTNGSPIANAHVNVYRAPENTLVGSGLTDANGNYTFTVAAGNYKFYFSPPFTTLVPEWYADKASINTANVVSVSANVTINAVLAVR
jgi:protocatechuate 3,4-dioxygenase beta subunit